MLTNIQLEDKAIPPHISPMPSRRKDPSRGSVKSMAYISESLQRKGWLSRLAAILPVLTRPRHGDLLDVSGLSDHLKRDMGFLDGVPTIKRR